MAFLTSWAKLHIASLCPLLSSSWKISVVLLFSVSGLESRHWHVIGCSTHQACPPRPGQPRRRHRQTWARLPPQRRAVWNEDADEEFRASAPRRAYLSIVLANGRGDAGTRQSGRGLNSVDSTVEPDERADALEAYMNAISAQADAERRPAREGNSRCVLLVGVLSAALSSWVAIAFLLRYVSQRGYALFAVYRVALGIVILALLGTRGVW